MKRTLYISLMSLLGMMITTSLYFVMVYSLVMNKIISLGHIIYFTDMTLSPIVLITMGLIGIYLGYRAGKKWWQIIYVDGVYYFNQALRPAETSGAPLTPRRRRMQKPVKKTEK